MKSAMLAAFVLAGLGAAGSAGAESLSAQERLLFHTDGTTPRSAAVQERMRQYDRVPDNRPAAVAPARDSLSRESLKVWWR